MYFSEKSIGIISPVAASLFEAFGLKKCANALGRSSTTGNNARDYRLEKSASIKEALLFLRSCRTRGL